MVLDVELYEVPPLERGRDPRAGVPEPRALPSMTVEAGSLDRCKTALGDALVKKGFKIRGINFGQNKAGRTCLIAYVYGEAS